eukprot:CAMPEP_0181212292 /NCGR_PEP_ID=MMETSP1096-20121128/24270_1 /TAXON_ID=156174 ORGANISM="Chrysochromulina ericina, Strain CCMP281" /NCGR_SAMPLE_ID=MMETSP1096 /ASSEMBLY_ACC=CAM_ASM_000453 /LENGTH=167 /DNA_ID=CAMNT_0023303807 /DNA_START=6 /DNA_END=509 /DNA_ORIENTATION=+
MNKGWTWLSLNVEIADMSLGSVFGDLSNPFVNDDYIKGQFEFSQYYAGYGFYGTLNTIRTDTMYKVKKASSAALTFAGEPTALPKAFTISAGWNYVPCPHQRSVALGEGLPSHSWVSGDTMKSQMQFATYYEGFGWFGQLSSLDPGQGYKMKVASSGSAPFPYLPPP